MTGLLDRLHDPARFRRRLVVLGVVALVVRVAYVLIERRDVAVWGDAYFYHHGANLLVDGYGFIDPLSHHVNGFNEQAADHPPLYILYLAFWSLVGVSGPLGHMLVSTLLGATTVLVAGLLGREVRGARAGLIAAALVACYPNTFGWDGMLLSETMALLLATTVVLAVYRYRASPTLGRVAIAGLAVGVAALSRAELLLLSALIVLPAVVGIARRSARERLVHLCVAGAACVGALAPWVAHNLTRFEHPVLVSAGFEVTLSSATCDETYRGPYTGYWNMQCALDVLREHDLTFANSDQSERSQAWREESLDYIGDNLDRVPYVVLARWGRVTGLYRPLQQTQLEIFVDTRERWMAYSGLFAWYGLAAAAVAGIVVLRRSRAAVYPLLGPALVVWIAITLSFGNNRYRAIAEGVLCVLAAVALDAGLRLYERLRDDPDDVPAPVSDDDGGDGFSGDDVATRDLVAPTT